MNFALTQATERLPSLKGGPLSGTSKESFCVAHCEARCIGCGWRIHCDSRLLEDAVQIARGEQIARYGCSSETSCLAMHGRWRATPPKVHVSKAHSCRGATRAPRADRPGR